MILAEGDARKMILKAAEHKKPDLLVIARHSNEPDGGFISRSLNLLVDELDYMTFGSVSAFCPPGALPGPDSSLPLSEELIMRVSTLFEWKRPEIRALHLTWIAFYICFFVWFGTPLASSMLKA